MIFWYFLSSTTISYFRWVHEGNWFFKTCPFGSGARMVIQNTYPNLSNIVHTDSELGRVMYTVAAADPGITGNYEYICRPAMQLLQDSKLVLFLVGLISCSRVNFRRSFGSFSCERCTNERGMKGARKNFNSWSRSVLCGSWSWDCACATQCRLGRCRFVPTVSTTRGVALNDGFLVVKKACPGGSWDSYTRIELALACDEQVTPPGTADLVVILRYTRYRVVMVGKFRTSGIQHSGFKGLRTKKGFISSLSTYLTFTPRRQMWIPHSTP